MRQIKFLFFVFIITASAYAQKPKKLPEKNKIVLAFAEKKIGKKVGKGWCRDLVKHALRKADCTWHKNGLILRTEERNDSIIKVTSARYGKLVKPDNVLPGDIITYHPFNKSDNLDEISLHTAIIYKVEAPRVFLIASQNNAYPDSEFKKPHLVKGAKVEIIKEDFSNGAERGYVMFFRPR